MRIARPIFLSATLAFAACGDDTKPQNDTVSDTAEPDTGDTDDTSDTDDASDTDDTDAAGDTDDTDVEVSPPCVPDEEIFDDPRIVSCNGRLNFVFYGEDLSASACPPYYRFNDTKYPSLEALAAAHGCDPSCEYRGTMAVDLIGCVNGFRTGYEVYRPFDETACAEAVYSTAGGLYVDLCEWPETACRADCNEDCAEGTVGALDAKQLSGAAGTQRLTPTVNLGQSFRAESAGILTGIELRLTQCDTAMSAWLAIVDDNGAEVAWAELADVPEGCDSTANLDDGVPGVGYFAIEGACVSVDVGDTLRIVAQYPLCEEQSCPDGIGLGYATGNPYVPGTLFINDDPIANEDLAFKVYIK